MDQRLSFVTLAVRDVARTRAFYVEGLGWKPELEAEGEVVMFRVADRVVLSLWDRKAFEAEVGGPAGEGLPPLTLAHNVASREAVTQVLDDARRAGAPHVSEATDRDWGGTSGYFADPDGFRWEVAWNPGPIGKVVLPGATQA